MREEQYTTKRWIVYCPSTQRYVNHEISFGGTDEKEEEIATCTGIEDCCSNCLFLLGYRSVGGSGKKKSVLSIQISKNK